MTFTEIYHAHKRAVLNLALHYTHNVQDAEEVMQDVFLKVHDKLPQFRGQSSVKTWVYRIAINQCLDFLKAKRAQKRWALLSALRLDHEDAPIEVPHFEHPGVVLEQREAMERVFRCIHQLPENQKTVIILLKIEQQTQAETAEIMQTSVKAVESLFQRAKKNLEVLLQQSEGK